jgi:hypothetical protein
VSKQQPHWTQSDDVNALLFPVCDWRSLCAIHDGNDDGAERPSSMNNDAGALEVNRSAVDPAGVACGALALDVRRGVAALLLRWISMACVFRAPPEELQEWIRSKLRQPVSTHTVGIECLPQEEASDAMFHGSGLQVLRVGEHEEATGLDSLVRLLLSACVARFDLEAQAEESVVAAWSWRDSPTMLAQQLTAYDERLVRRLAVEDVFNKVDIPYFRHRIFDK